LTSLLGTLRQRLDVVKALSTRYPLAQVQIMPADSRDDLQRLFELHGRALTGELQELNARIPILCGTDRPPREAGRSLPVNWPVRAVGAATTAATLDRLIWDLMSREEPTLAQRRQVLATFDALWDSLIGRGIAS
jgi:hypothetical protein